MRRLSLMWLVMFAGALGFGQPFEAADVHASAPGTTESGGFLPNGRVEFRAHTLLQLIGIAYSTPAERVAGGPSWINTDRFDVVAMAGSNAPQAALRTKLQSLLGERFGLAVQRGEKPQPVYLLLPGQGPPKESSGPGDPACQLDAGAGGRAFTCHHMSMAGIAERLPLVAPGYFNRPVIDRTGYKGVYDFKLEWVPRTQLPGGEAVFGWVEKPLRIKVEAQDAPLPVLSIERVNRTPSANPPGTMEKLGAPPTEFEVASFYRSRPDETQDVNMSGGRLEVKALSPREMIAFAYNVEESWVKGGEKWLDTDRYDLRAKSAPTASADTMRVMVQSLLRDRFRLKVHKEDQPVPVFALTAVKPKMKEADAAARSLCKLQMGGTRSYTCEATTMAELAAKLPSLAPRYIDHPVVDLTALKGSYDFTLSWMTAPVLRAEGAPADADRPVGLTIFEAIDRQLGLKLAPARHPMQVLVIDSMDRAPTEN